MITTFEVNGIPVTIGREDGFIIEITEPWMQEIEKITTIATIIGGGTWSLEGERINTYNLNRDGGCEEGGITIHFYRDYRDEKSLGRREYWRFSVSGSYPEKPRNSTSLTPSDAPSQTVNIEDPFKAGAPIMRMIPGIEKATATVRDRINGILLERAKFTENASRLAALNGRTLGGFDPSLSEFSFSVQAPGAIDMSGHIYRSSSDVISLRVGNVSYDELVAIRDLLVGMRTVEQPLSAL
jgi:hypothetical protein